MLTWNHHNFSGWYRVVLEKNWWEVSEEFSHMTWLHETRERKTSEERALASLLLASISLLLMRHRWPEIENLQANQQSTECICVEYEAFILPLNETHEGSTSAHKRNHTLANWYKVEHDKLWKHKLKIIQKTKNFEIPSSPFWDIGISKYGVH